MAKQANIDKYLGQMKTLAGMGQEVKPTRQGGDQQAWKAAYELFTNGNAAVENPAATAVQEQPATTDTVAAVIAALQAMGIVGNAQPATATVATPAATAVQEQPQPSHKPASVTDIKGNLCCDIPLTSKAATGNDYNDRFVFGYHKAKAIVNHIEHIKRYIDLMDENR